MRVIAFGVLILIVFCGCERKVAEPKSVEGVVTFLGRPLSGGLIVMTPDRGRGMTGKPVIASIHADGHYALPAKEMLPGWYRVSISDPATWNVVEGFPPALRKPDCSGLSRQILAGREHRFDFLIDASR
ncbi:MAG: hypothetical protein U0798_09660 [Gemmataceae bacterium]